MAKCKSCGLEYDDAEIQIHGYSECDCGGEIIANKEYDFLLNQ